jgi:16S rRNA (guanine527-N7)-methyltransferase
MCQFEDRSEIAAIAGRALDHLGVPSDGRLRELLAAYAIEICAANQKTNLTGAKDPAAFVRGPLFDALTLLPVLAADAPLVDVGSGGGLPGVPAALWRPELRVALVEPRPLRVAFLRRAVAALGIPAEVIEAKEAALADGAYAAAASQAVWPATEWIRRAARLVRRGGAIYALASTPIDAAALPAGCAIEARLETARPADGAARFAVRIRVGRGERRPYS